MPLPAPKGPLVMSERGHSAFLAATVSSRREMVPGGLWSLWDMLLAYGHLFTDLMDRIDRLCEVAQQDPSGTAKSNFTTGSLGDIHPGVIIHTAGYLARELGMRSVTDQVGRINKMIELLDSPLSRIASECWQLRVRLQEELRRKEFLFVSEDMTALYKETDPFKLGDKFKKAHADVLSATRCLAFGEGTACILHLDRAMEVALRRLATRLSAPIGPRDTWGSILNNMSPRIARMPDATRAQKDKKQAWSEARTHLFHIKECWRDRPAHGQETYSPERAKEIFEAVRVFMNHLA